MTCRTEVLGAFESLGRSTARVDFAPAEILAEVRRLGSSYADSTVRTHVVAHMLEDGTLVRSAPGRYRLARHASRPLDLRQPATADGATERMPEDFVKQSVATWLEADGWRVDVKWGRERGIDIEANRGDERWVIEAKGEAPRGPQQANYFLGALGELTQRMSDDTASYGIALPDHLQYRGLVERLPDLACQRLQLSFMFVTQAGQIDLVPRCTEK